MIDWKLKLTAVISIVIVMLVITHFVKKDKILLKYAILWYASLLVLIAFILFPEFLGRLTDLAGMKLSSNFLFVLLIAFLFFICISLTIIVSQQKEQIRKLVQEVSLIKGSRDEKSK